MVFLGDSGTGKTSLIRQFVHRSFEASHQATVGMDFLNKAITLEAPRELSEKWGKSEDLRRTFSIFFMFFDGFWMVFGLCRRFLSCF